MKSIEKLREWLDYKINRYDMNENAILLNTGANPNDLYDIADEIEAEIAANYLELPKDADGVPIHVGDKVEWLGGNGVYIVCGVGLLVSLRTHESNCFTISSRCLRIVKPRTLEDVIRDVVTLCFNTWKKPSAFEYYDVNSMMESENIQDFTDEIRELMGGDAE